MVLQAFAGKPQLRDELELYHDGVNHPGLFPQGNLEVTLFDDIFPLLAKEIVHIVLIDNK